MSIAGTLICLAGDSDAQPTTGAAGPSNEQPLKPVETQKCSMWIDVHIVDASTHEPVAGASVAANGKVMGFTNENGRLRVGPVCAGAVTIEAERGDYQARTRKMSLKGSTSLELSLRAAGETIEIHGEEPVALDMRSTTEVTGEALERTRGRSFSDTLAEVPGVGQLRSANGLAKPIVRGQFGRRLPMLVSGMRHRSQEWGLDHAPEIDPFVADSISVVRGAAGVRYGPDAIGGAVLVDPPKLLEEPGLEGESHVIGMLSQGGSMALRLKFSPEENPEWAGQVEASYKRLTSPSTPDYALDNTGSEEGNVGATVGYRTDDSEYLLSYRRYFAELGICSCLRVESASSFMDQLELERPVDAHLYEASFDIDRPYQTNSHDALLARGHWDSSLGNTTATLNFQYDHRREYDVVRTATGPQFNFRLTTLDTELHHSHKPVHLSNHLHLKGSAGVVGNAQVHFYSGLPLVPDYNAFGGGAYAIERLVGHDFELEVGARYDYLHRDAAIDENDFSRLVRSDQIEEDACTDPDADQVFCDSGYHTASLTVGALKQITDAWSVKANLATASRPPNPDEQYLNGTSPTMPVLGLGKPDLTPETTYSASLTSTYQSQNLAAEVSAFSNYIDDYIYFAPAVNDMGEPVFDVLIRGIFPRFVTRPVDATFYGFDGGFAYNLLPSLQVGAQASMVRARNLTDDEYLAFVPADRLRTSLTYSHKAVDESESYFASVAATAVAKQDRVDIRADFAPPPDGYVLVDGELGWTTTLSDQKMTISAQGTNLLNTRYRDYTSLLRYYTDQMGMQLMLRLSLHFSN